MGTHRPIWLPLINRSRHSPGDVLTLGDDDELNPDWATPAAAPGGESSVLPSEPTDGSLVAGDCKLWFSDTAGAPTLHVKSKDANGAVFTATIPLTAA